jgi:hypothetical protein
LNWDQRFRKPLLYPFELRGRTDARKNTAAAANGKNYTGGQARAGTISLCRRRRFA